MSAQGRTVLVTRPQPDADSFAKELEARGYTCVVTPLFGVAQASGPDLDVDGVQAFAATSANGSRALSMRTTRRDIPLFAVGAATAEEARARGFATVVAAGGDLPSLVDTIAARLDPAKGEILHGAGRDLAGDLAAALAARGFGVRRETLYAAGELPTLPQTAREALAADTLDAVTLFSPRAASVFARLVRAAGLEDHCRRLDMVCLSPAVETALADLPCARILVASRPEQAALIEALEARSPVASPLSPPLPLRSLQPQGNPPMSDSEMSPPATPPTGAAPASEPTTAPRRRHGLFEDWRDGWLGIGVLLAASAFLGALFSSVVPIFAWLGPTDDSDMAARLAELEMRVGQIATGNPDAAASGAFSDLAARLDGLEVRVRAVESAVAAVETHDGAPLPSGDLQQKLEAAVAMIGDLSGRLSALESRAPTTNGLPDPNAVAEAAQLRRDLETLGQRVVALEQGTPGELLARMEVFITATMNTQATLEDRVGKLERADPAAAAKRAALALALNQLTRATQGPGPFRRELDTIVALGAEGVDFSSLGAQAEGGLPTTQMLAQSFSPLAPQMLDAAIAARDEDWLDWFWRNLVSLVSVRRVGEAEGDDPEARIARAEQRLADGNLGAAVGEVAALDPAVRAPAESWLAQAQARLDLQAKLAELSDRLLTALAQSGTSPTP